MFQLCSGEASVPEARLIVAILVTKVGTVLGVGEVGEIFVVRVCLAPGDGEVIVIRVITGRGVDVERLDISLPRVRAIGQVLVILVMGVRGCDSSAWRLVSLESGLSAKFSALSSLQSGEWTPDDA